MAFFILILISEPSPEAEISEDSKNLSGRSAQIFVDPCVLNPCKHGGTCKTRTRNSSKDHPCQTNPCLNNGICSPARNVIGNAYFCICPQGYSGRRCETFTHVVIPQYPEVCNPNPCKGDCQCTKSCRHSSGYYCRSPTGFLGKDCTIPPPTLMCEPNRIIVIVEDAFIREYEQGIENTKLAISQTADGIATASRDCSGSFDGTRHTFTLHLPFTQCATQAKLGPDGQTTFVNNIWLNRVLGEGFDMPVPAITFECTYQKQYSIVTSLKPAREQPLLIKQTGTQIVQGSIELCKVPYSCPNACPSPYALTQGAVYTVGEMIHLNINGGRGQFQGLITINELSLSCDDAPNGNVAVTLISDECPLKNMPVVISHSGVSQSVCISFQVPKLQNCERFYIHAKLQSCSENGCVVFHTADGTCFQLGRKRRDVEDESIPFEYFEQRFGPIHVIDGEVGIPNELLFPGDETGNFSVELVDNPTRIVQGLPVHEIPFTSKDDTTDIAIMVVTVVGFCIIFSLLISIVLYLRIRKEKFLCIYS
uniref:uncharacterized protein LOC120335331 n=1 Tax=Styela clava TaxID=7725 RepID=UPI00193A912A|nr:uncharacterized protein LOC120335331 [Styela clava]